MNIFERGGDELDRAGRQGVRDAAPPALVSPVIKYVGGKKWLLSLVLSRLHLHLASTSGLYVEPFCGGLAMGLGIGWPRSIFSDLNGDLVNLYQALAVDPEQVADVLAALAVAGSDEQSYYERRREVWPENRPRLNQFEWAARVIYLNKVGFNGLWRVNAKAQFNVPWGKREGSFPSRDHLLRAGAVLRRAEIQQADFGEVLHDVEVRGDCAQLAVVLDPPYVGRVFTGYTIGGFLWADQVRLAEDARRLARAGACVVASNMWSDAVCDLWRDGFYLFPVRVRHVVGATGARRGQRLELLAIG